MTNSSENFYDVAIVGGGPAGLMAAIQAAKSGANVIIFEKNNRFGVKLLISGHGRANITNEISIRDFIEKIGLNGKFLHSTLNQFGPNGVIDFFNSIGVKVKTEAKNRVFPESNLATTVLDGLVSQLEKYNVECRFNSEVESISVVDGEDYNLKMTNGKTFKSKALIIATGGISYSATGSTGSGYRWARSLGHEVIDPHPGLVALKLADKFFSGLEGLSLYDVEVLLKLNNKKVASATGDLIFTKNGVSGPVIHDLSRFCDEGDGLTLEISMYDGTLLELETELQAGFHENGLKQLKNALSKYLTPKLIPVVILNSQVDQNKKQNEITKAERTKLASAMHKMILKVSGVEGFDRANVTVGGVNLQEVDPKTMESKKHSGLYFAGEILDLDGPTGGYNLQICWSTGYTAGRSAVAKIYSTR